ncbi:putative CBS domain-containing protein [Helianthus anomalus]
MGPCESDIRGLFACDCVNEALQLVDNKAHSRFGICTRSDTLYQVITLLSDPGVRRVVVLEAGSQRVLGLITLRDVFSLIFRDYHLQQMVQLFQATINYQKKKNLTRPDPK